MTETIESGDIYFFYRSRIEVAEPSSLDDIQTFQLVMIADGAPRGRMITVGKKRLPEIFPEESDPSEREWMIIGAVAQATEIGEMLHPFHYQTTTRGERRVGEALPVAEARYAIVMKDGSSFLTYRLHRPRDPGSVQEEFGIRASAGYVIAIRNPELEVPGFPRARPEYPQELVNKFADERWIAVDDASLLDYENAQLVLIGATEEAFDAGNRLLQHRTDLFDTLGLNRSDWPVGALTDGIMAAPEFRPESFTPRGDPSKGGRRGGRRALDSPSAAGVARALKGIDFPARRDGLLDRARENNANDAILETLEQLEAQRFDSMSDVEKALGRIR